jgi:hypothetical protein
VCAIRSRMKTACSARVKRNENVTERGSFIEKIMLPNDHTSLGVA